MRHKKVTSTSSDASYLLLHELNETENSNYGSLARRQPSVVVSFPDEADSRLLDSNGKPGQVLLFEF